MLPGPKHPEYARLLAAYNFLAQILADALRATVLHGSAPKAYAAIHLLQASAKTGSRRGKTEVTNALMVFAEEAAYSDNAEEMDEDNLLVGMAKKLEYFNGLKYPWREFFDLVVRWENVFHKCLNGANYCALGSFLV